MRISLLQAVSAACPSSRHAWAADGLSVRPTKHGQSNVERPTAVHPHGCAHVLARAHPRAWQGQGLRRRFSSPPRAAARLEREHSYESSYSFI
jgi:hypothetical protein